MIKAKKIISGFCTLALSLQGFSYAPASAISYETTNIDCAVSGYSTAQNEVSEDTLVLSGGIVDFKNHILHITDSSCLELTESGNRELLTFSIYNDEDTIGYSYIETGWYVSFSNGGKQVIRLITENDGCYIPFDDCDVLYWICFWVEEPDESTVDKIIEWGKEHSLTKIGEETEKQDDLFCYNGHTYQVIDKTDSLTWFDEKSKCNEKGGHLLTIGDSNEQFFVQQLLKQYVSINPKCHYVDIGGYLDDDNSWKWVDDTPFEYENWNINQPDNYKGNENVLSMYAQDSGSSADGWYEQFGKWNDFGVNDEPDSIGHYYICEWDYEIEGAKELSIKPDSSRVYNGHTYAVYSSVVSWAEAKSKCEALGGHLATITSAEEQCFLETINGNVRRWIGGYRNASSSNDWKWVTDENWDYTHWGDGEPNNSDNVISNENCVAMWPDYWNDLNEDSEEQEGYICEWDDEYNAPNTFYELRYKPNNSKTILTAKFDKSNHMYDLDLLAEKWNSHVYCPELAHILSVVASSAYTKESTYDDITGYNMKQLGFTDYNPYNYYDTTDIRYEKDSVAFTIAKKKLSNGDTLVLIPMRGSYGDLLDAYIYDYDQSDWQSDFRIKIGKEIVNIGFINAAEFVLEHLIAEMDGKLPTSGVKYFITGHSRAAGVGNILTKRMIDRGVPQENIFDYNFACPDVVKDKDSNWNPNNKYASIFNLCVPGDLISVLPGATGNILIHPLGSLKKQWGKYGNSYWFAENWDIIPNANNLFTVLECHDYGHYVDVFSKEINIWKAKSYSEFKRQQSINKSSISILPIMYNPPGKTIQLRPSLKSSEQASKSTSQDMTSINTNIEILNSSGTVLASVFNDEIEYKTDDDELLIIAWTDEEERHIAVYGRNDIKYRFIGVDRNEASINCLLSSYVDNNNYTDCYAYYENVNVPENSIVEMSIDSVSDQQSTVLAVLDSEYSVINTISATSFISSSMYGDLTGDRDISVDDAQLTLKAYTERIAGNDMKLTAEQIIVADVNGDGEISVDDAQNILKYYTEKSVAGKNITWNDILD